MVITLKNSIKVPNKLRKLFQANVRKPFHVMSAYMIPFLPQFLFHHKRIKHFTLPATNDKYWKRYFDKKARILSRGSVSIKFDLTVLYEREMAISSILLGRFTLYCRHHQDAITKLYALKKQTYHALEKWQFFWIPRIFINYFSSDVSARHGQLSFSKAVYSSRK